MKKKIHLLIFIVLIFLIAIIGINKPVYATDDVYDVILFWGQSNMTGYAGTRDWEKQKDERVEKVGIEKFSELTGIKKEILENYDKVNHVKVEQVKGTAFEYIYSEKLNADGKTRGSLKELDEKTEYVGQKLVYNEKTGLLEKYNKNKHSYYSIQKSYGTNMIPQFCNQYYKRTGHKVIVVMCANGGERIANFLPSTDKEYGDVKKQYIYEAMVEKYKSAINYLEKNNYKIGQKLYVVYQGESDVSKTSEEEYEKLFLKVHNNLKNELGITKGAIVLLGRKPESNYDGMKAIVNAQRKLIKRSDIILGSSFAYKNYIPHKVIYSKKKYINSKYTDSKGEKLSYSEALKISRYSLCYNKDEDKNNDYHYTSAALSQIGYEVANSFAKVSKIKIKENPKKLEYIKGETLDTKGLKIEVTYANDSTKNITSGFECTPTKLDKVGKQEITVKYKEKTARFNVTVKEKEVPKVELSKIEIEKLPSKVEYIKGDTLNTNGLKIKATYTDKSTKSITTGFECTPTKLDRVGKQEITVKYEGKTVAFNVTVKNKETYHTDNLKVGNTLKLKKGYAWWTYTKYTDQNPYHATKYRAILGGDNVQIVNIDGNWLKVKVTTTTHKTNKKNFKVGDVYYIYYGSTAKLYFDVVK